jgi:3-hydroxyisobutyrate dehydrogenase-like beta-hydroxyacid dehydrogenase
MAVTVGFIGVGNMGNPMAANVLKAFPMIVFDMMTPGNVQRVVKGETVGTIVVPDDEKVR